MIITLYGIDENKELLQTSIVFGEEERKKVTDEFLKSSFTRLNEVLEEKGIYNKYYIIWDKNIIGENLKYEDFIKYIKV